MSGILEVRDITVRSGTRSVVNGMSMDLEPGRHVTMLRPNGAGSMHGLGESGSEIDGAPAFFPKLQALRGHRAGSMSGGQQQKLAIAQALIARPRFLLLDGMSLGLAPASSNAWWTSFAACASVASASC